MKKFLIVFVSQAFLLAFFSFMVSLPNHSALAIDRTPKEGEATEKEEPAEIQEYEKTGVKEGKIENSGKGGAEGVVTPKEKSDETKKQIPGEIKEPVPAKLTKWLKSLEKPKAKEKYDYFIDKNNNGIDDRLERKPGETTPPPAIRPIPKEKEPVKPAPSAKETEEKEKIKKTPKEKESKRERR